MRRKSTSDRIRIVPAEHIDAENYLTNPQTRDADRKKVLELLRGKEGVADLIEPDRFAELGLPLPEKNGGMGDLVLVPKDGYGVSAAATGSEFILPISGTMNVGYHGYLASNPRMNALLIAAGDGIKKGIKIGLVDNIDVAPTIAHVLGRHLIGRQRKGALRDSHQDRAVALAIKDSQSTRPALCRGRLVVFGVLHSHTA